MARLIVLLSLIICCLACNSKQKKPHAPQEAGNSTTAILRSFYFWKSNESYFSDGERNFIKELSLDKIYVKFFEVAPHPFLSAIPEAKTQLHFNGPDYFDRRRDSIGSEKLSKVKIIPTIFIQNSVFQKISDKSLDSLVENISFLVFKIYNGHFPQAEGRAFDELQVDCDWTAKTKDKYFLLLKKLKAALKVPISCTLRLYPYKYRDKMGVPPVDRVSLMCYNLLSPLGNNDKNSILDVKELEAYLTQKTKYPIPIDLALPIFSWMQLYQNNHFAGLIYHNSPAFIANLKEVSPLWYEVQKDTVIGDYYIREGDLIKWEEVKKSSLEATIKLLKERIIFDKTCTVSFFHFDENIIKHYSHETINNYYNSLVR